MSPTRPAGSRTDTGLSLLDGASGPKRLGGRFETESKSKETQTPKSFPESHSKTYRKKEPLGPPTAPGDHYTGILRPEDSRTPPSSVPPPNFTPRDREKPQGVVSRNTWKERETSVGVRDVYPRLWSSRRVRSGFLMGIRTFPWSRRSDGSDTPAHWRSLD